MAIEKSVLDRVINSGYLGKRKIGSSALKYNIREKGYQGWIELVFAPRNQAEQLASTIAKFIHPYLFFITYRFHVEKAREAGMRVEDVYCNKFHKEPYIMFHLYAQHFHPSTLLERVRDVRFYRQPRTMFKGFTVPDWATAQQQHGWEFDAYSRQAWSNAMHDLRSEWTPTQFVGERQEPNVFQWLRWEQFGKGFSSRLFYNETPQPTWFRHGGHMLADANDDKERERALHSFCHADQDRQMIFGMDTSTEEGRAAFKAEYDTLAELAPEIIKKDEIVFPHEMPEKISSEPHFQRAWQHYRNFAFKQRLAIAIEHNLISQADADAFGSFVGLNTSEGTPSLNLYLLTKEGKLAHYENQEGYQASTRVMEVLGLNAIEFCKFTAQPMSEQFWGQYDGVFDLTEETMMEDLPLFVTDPSNVTAVEALMEGRKTAALE